ncbi:hypothetical protein C9374_011549 [Naegleria lovaniensis]|uniref:Prenylcysteine lyase domain-containing protein n=1 Tax=Naegleria lovaniensis TaxID=51637 RepID=A0AA88H374_NAELO|nr:uncharacterized protein C9374_011549 [Naegleria lovaniensis]KAG2392824.1 hypothetical protein C9374_011549 [Naegleria lovaniensis]
MFKKFLKPFLFLTLGSSAAGLTYHQYNQSNEQSKMFQSTSSNSSPISTHNTPTIRVAIIGSGISGSGAAYFLSDLYDRLDLNSSPLSPEPLNHDNDSTILKPPLEFILYERNDELGGRLKEINLFPNIHDETNPYKYSFEVGGSSLILENKYALQLVDRFGLTLKEPHFEDIRIGIWNGDEKQIVFCESRSWWKTMIKGAWRYDFGIPLYLLKRNVNYYLSQNRFLKIYELQQVPQEGKISSEDVKKVYTWEETSEFLKETGMQELTTQTFYEFARNNWIQERFVKEYCDSILRINYMTSSETISAFAGIVGLAGAVSDFRQVLHGTSQLPKNCIQALKSKKLNLKLNHEVSQISYDSASNKYSISAVDLKAKANNSAAHILDTNIDYIIVATPLEFTNIRFENIQLPPKALEKREMNILVTSLVIAKDINKNYFGMDSSDGPLYITTMKPLTVSQLPFNNIAPQGEAPNSENTSDKKDHIFESFSHSPFTKEVLNEIYVGPSKLVQQYWKHGSYPILKPNLVQPPVKLHQRIYYPNSMESVISTMETSLISSKNVSLLIIKDMLKRFEQ